MSPPDEPNRGPGPTFAERLSLAVGAPVDPGVDLDGGAGATRKIAGAQPTSSGTSGVLGRMQSRPGLSSRYRIDGEIARGGMGAILEVWDEDLRRRLAMKVALGGSSGSGSGAGGASSAADKLDPRLLSRFLEEAQVTGQLEHPGIVPVHELGIDDNGVVFFTMQLVRGRDLEEVLGLVADGTEGWSVTRVLGVLLKVCEAMAYAHTKGVLHRDLKPANIMVGSFGEVYVMDWGLVRVRGREDRHDVRVADDERVETDLRTDAAGESDDLYTMDGDVLGTPAYMSPEQARGDIEELDARSDVYAVGAMLYRLLGGVAPFDRPGAPRLRARETLAAMRAGLPLPLADLAPDAPAELVAITEKAMSPSADERYPDMLGLAEDLRAFLENRVVQAYQTGAVAEARKWVRRNRPLAVSMAAGMLALVFGLVASLVFKAESDANADQARRQASIAREVADFMNNDLFAAIAPDQQGLDVTVREVLAIASGRLDGRFDDEPLVEAELRRTIGTSFDGLGDYETARGHLERAYELLVAEFGERSEPALATALQIGSVMCSLGEFDDALAFMEELTERCEAALGPNAALTLEARYQVANAHRGRGELEHSIELFAELEGILRRELGDQHAITLATLITYSGVLQDLGRLDEAEALQVEALASTRATLGDHHPETMNAADSLGEILVAQGRTAEAETLLLATQQTREDVLGPDHPFTANGLGQVGTHYFVQGRVAEAEQLYSRAYEMLRRSLGSEHHYTLMMANNLAGALNRLGRNEEALELREATLDAQRRTLGPEHHNTILSQSNLAVVLQQLGRYEEAEAAYFEAFSLLESVYGAEHPDTWIALENLSGLWLAQGKTRDSIELTERVLEGRKRALGAEHPAVARTLFNLGIGASSLGDRDAARTRFQEALDVARVVEAVDVATRALAELAELSRDDGDVAGAQAGYLEAVSTWRAFGTDDVNVADWLYEAGRCTRDLGDYDEAARLTGEALALRRELLGDRHILTLRAMLSQAKSLQAAGRFEGAVERVLEAHEILLADKGAGSSDVVSARAMLAELYEAWGRPDEAARWR